MRRTAFFPILLFSLIIMSQLSWPAPVTHLPHTITQPDGFIFDCFLSGDEFHLRMHDANNFTIIQDPRTGFYVYAVRHGAELAATNLRAGLDDPRRGGLTPGIDLPADQIRQRRQRYPYMAGEGAEAPPTGTINNLVIYIRFADQAEFSDSIAYYNRMFNNSASGASSMYNYFVEASYNNLFVSSTHYPLPGVFTVSYQDSHNRNYYLPYNASSNPDGYQNDTERRTREHGLLRDAVNAVANQVPPGLNIDADNDGRVDNVCFIIRGDHSNWADLLWPHRWALYTYNAYINSKRVWDYNLQLELFLKQHSDVAVLVHEMGHSVGYPDLYHYYYGTNLSPCGTWDVMCSTPNPPTHMGVYMKNYYTGWIASIPQISVSGTYWVRPITSAVKNAYRIPSPNTNHEYFIVEYRRKTGTFENSLPGSGLLVYRINNDFAGQGNASYNGTTIFDEVYIYRPDGTPTTNGIINSAHFSANVGRTAINDSTNPSSFLHDGSPGGLKISAVSTADDSISFYVDLGIAVQEPSKPALTTWQLRIEPNPFRNNLTICVRPGVENIKLKIYDITGKMVKDFPWAGLTGSKSCLWSWDGRDQTGCLVPPGIYFCRIEAGAGTAVRKIVRIE